MEKNRGFVAIWNGIAHGAEADFKAWHADEHMPERLAIPGFLSGERWGRAGESGYFTLYTLADAAIAGSRAYIDRLNAPTAWTRRVMGTFTDNARCVGGFVVDDAFGEASRIGVLRLDGSRTDFSTDATASDLRQIPGVSGVRIGLADAQVSSLPSAERRGRQVTEPWGLVIAELADDAEPAPLIDALDRLAAAHGPQGADIMALELRRQTIV